MTDKEAIETGKYFRNELSPEARKAFEQRLRSETDFASEVNLELDVMRSISDEGILKLEKHLESIHAEAKMADEIPGKGSFSMKRPYLAAASVTFLLVAASLVIYSLWPPPGHSELFAHYYVPYQLENMRGTNHTLRDGIQKYRNQEYRLARDQFEQILASDPSRIGMTFLIGHCFLNTADLGNAIHSFEAVIAHQNNVYVAEAMWYAALTHVKAQNTDEARQLLLQITLDKSKYHVPAQGLLEKLERMDQ